MAAFAGASSCVRSRGPSLIAGLLRPRGAGAGAANTASCSSSGSSRLAYSVLTGQRAAVDSVPWHQLTSDSPQIMT